MVDLENLLVPTYEEKGKIMNCPILSMILSIALNRPAKMTSDFSTAGLTTLMRLMMRSIVYQVQFMMMMMMLQGQTRRSQTES